MDDWSSFAPALEAMSQALDNGQVESASEFDPRQAHSFLPRAYGWIDEVPTLIISSWYVKQEARSRTLQHARLTP